MEEKKTKTSEPMLSTIDNPFNPFKDFDKWNQFDQSKGYFTLSYLGRIVDYSNCVTEEQKKEERVKAIENILECNPLHIYCKVYSDDSIVPIELKQN